MFSERSRGKNVAQFWNEKSDREQAQRNMEKDDGYVNQARGWKNVKIDGAREESEYQRRQETPRARAT